MVECCTNLNVEAPPRVKRVQSPEFLENPYDLNDKEEERLNLIEDDYEDLIFQSGELMRLKFLYSGEFYFISLFGMVKNVKNCRLPEARDPFVP